MNDRIQRLVKTVLESEIFPEPVPVEYNPLDELLPEALRIAKRLSEYMAAQPLTFTEDNHLVGLMRFDGSVPSDIFPRTGHRCFHELLKHYYFKPQENLCTLEWQHSNADFGKLIAKGLNGFIEDINRSRVNHKGDPEALAFLAGMEETIYGILNRADLYARHCAALARRTENPVRKARLFQMSHNCSRVPRNPAGTFEEAVQCVYFCFMFLADSIGRADQYLYPLYREGIRNRTLTRERAKELLQELFVMINGWTPCGSGNADRGAESHFVVGGYTGEHEDGFNELSALIVESMMETDLFRPQVSLRRTDRTPLEVLRKMLDYERRDPRKRIAFVNDEPRIKALMKIAEIDFETASGYIMVGCNEPAFQGSISMGGNTVNILRSLLNALHLEGIDSCGSFGEFYALYETELHRDLEKILEYSNRFNLLRSGDLNVLSSIFLNGCIESAKSVTRGGVKYPSWCANMMGFVNVIDSLTVIRQFVFEEKRFDMRTLTDALDRNWTGCEELRRQILRDGRFFGNAEELSDSVARMFTTSLFKFANGKKDVFGIPLRYGNLTGYNPHYAQYGALTGASPDGRFAGDPLKYGSGQSGGYDRNGPTALLASVAQMDPTGILCGNTILNLMVDSSVTSSAEGFEKLVLLVDTYFKMGGLHIQLNHVSPEELAAARKTPERYSNLRVRVSGFSATFVKLSDSHQLELIQRTGHSKVSS